MLISGFIVLGPIIDSPQVEYVYVLLFAVSGLVLYVPFVYYKKTFFGISMIQVLKLVLSFKEWD